MNVDLLPIARMNPRRTVLAFALAACTWLPAQAQQKLVAAQSGILTPNDCRRGLGFPAHADGDALRPVGVPSFPADVKGMAHLGPSPGHTGDGLPATGTNQGSGGS